MGPVIDPPIVYRRSLPGSIRACIGTVVTTAITIVFIVVLIPVVGLVTGRLRVVPILSGSMEPAIPNGAVLIATPVAMGEVRPGAIILYRIPIGDRHVEAHRVVRVLSSGAHPVVITKGDANATSDPWQARLDGPLVWKARFAVPWVGNTIVFLRRAVARTLMLIAAVALLLWVGLRLVWAGSTTEQTHEHATP